MGVSAHLGRQNQPLVSMKYPTGSRLGLVMGRRSRLEALGVSRVNYSCRFSVN